MKNYQKEILKYILSLVYICFIVICFFTSAFMNLNIFEKLIIFCSFLYSLYLFIFSGSYIIKYIKFKDIIMLTEYDVENREKYNKWGKYYINRDVVKINGDTLKSNWRIDFREKYSDNPLSCKTDGCHYILI